MNAESYSSNDIKYSILDMPKLSQKLIGICKPYEKLLLAILSIDRDSKERLPIDKRMIQELGIKPHFFRKWLNQIYDDLLELLSDEHSPQMIIRVLEHHITWYRWGKSFYFVTRLPVMPRVGEAFNMNFFRPIYNIPVYYVDKVTHHITQEKCPEDRLLQFICEVPAG